MVAATKENRHLSLTRYSEYATPWPFLLPDGNEFRALRVVLDYSQETVAKTMGVARNTITSYESGATGVPTSLNGEWPRRVLSAMVEMAVPEWTAWCHNQAKQFDFVKARLSGFALMQGR